MAAQEPLASPILLKFGFSSVVEFSEPPTEVVLGDSKAFQIERLKNALVLRPLQHSTSTNAFVYFRKLPPRLLILTASDDATPTYYRKLTEIVLPPRPNARVHVPSSTKIVSPAVRVVGIEFRVPRDFLTVDLKVTANSSREISPRWDLARLNFRGRSIAAKKVWSSRRQVMRDSAVSARFIFFKPDVPASLEGVELELPLAEGPSLKIPLKSKETK